MKERKTMKRLLPLLCAAAIVFTGASIWEGAVTTAPRGALPDEGYYAATNSFPRNTVVDITNLETGKTIRVIVSSGLDTPGLLATLSEDAAKSIGLQTRSIGRIRMTQPSDPIAFSRFTEGLTGSGDPDYDPEAMLETEDADYETGGFEEEPDLVLIPAPRQPVTEEAPVFSGKEEDYFSIVDVPNPEREEEGDTLSSSGDEDDYYGEFPEEGETELAEAEEEDSPEKTLYPVWAQGGSVGVPVSPEAEAEIAGGASDSVPDPVPGSAPDSVPDPVQEKAWASAQPDGEPPAQLATQGDGTGSWASAWVTAPLNPVEPPAPGTYDYSLVPAEKRPPVDTGVYSIPPEAEIGPIVQSAPAQAPRRSEPAIDSSLFIESIEDMRDRAPVISAAPEEILPEPVLAEAFLSEPAEPALPEPVIIVEEPALPETSPSAGPPKAAAIPKPAPDRFSIPVIGELEKGQYYLQLGAYSKPDILESSVSKLDSHYPLSVQTAGSPDKPIYRLLLGPVNLGESGALMQRFKGSGYSDVFVRTY
ncbi:MAG: SPOR domain-containing protein [Treponema sp.]|jgi:hypothetical protein|nr:SPOR domain-containing protein [Treponema sp.]